MLASVSGEVAVVAVDHRQARAHVAGEVAGGDSGTEREGREGVPQIVDAPSRLDPGRHLGGFPVAGAEVVQVEVAAMGYGKQQRRLRIRWKSLASVLVPFSRPFVKARRT